ncbi:MAG: metal ABC transporter substrate-binding protein [bacterium]|nr:metal ABC transporter substrate-binding protein [bacterium]
MNIKPVFLIFLLVGCSREPNTPSLKIGATTSLIGVILQEIGKEKVDVVTIVPSGMCPGHFDVKPGDIKDLQDAKVIMSHGYEEWIENLLNSMNIVNKPLRIEGNWMVPEVHKIAAKEITKILTEISPENTNFYLDNLTDYEKLIDSFALEVSESTNTFKGIKVICSEHQAEFLEWLGFNIITTYGRPEELTPKEILNIVNIGKKEQVDIVVDNLQSGGKGSREIANEISARYTVLTNFPLDKSYIKALRENINKLVQAISE